MSTILLICKNTIKQLVTEALRSPVEKVFLGIGLQSGREFRVIEVQECLNISNNPQIHFTADPLCLYRLFSYAVVKLLCFSQGFIRVVDVSSTWDASRCGFNVET